MSGAFFPVLPGLSWSVHKQPNFSTLVSKHVSGRSVRAANYATPLYGFELTYEILRADQAHLELQTLAGFFLARQGQFDSFLFQELNATGDLADSVTSGQLLGTGDGTTRSYIFLRPVGPSYVEPVGQVETTGLNVYLNGALQAGSTYTVTLPNMLTFTTAPGAGVAVTADYTFYFVCCFDDDVQDYENFMHQLWTLQSCKFSSVKL